MSRLSSLFGGSSGESETNEALKYSAPKEPKQKTTSSVNITTKNPSISSTIPSSTPKSAPSSKVIVSATVRLFKYNIQTNTFDAHESGQPLGFVIAGARMQYQLLIYNSQKAPQCIVPITTKFQCNVKDFYLSLTDPLGISWSILFDSLEVISNVLKNLVVIFGYLSNAPGASPSKGYYKEILQSNSFVSDEDLIGSGYTIGIHYSVWELSEEMDYATDILNQTPLLSLQPPEDLMKVKLGNSSEELFKGFNDMLIGSKKGSKVIIAIEPKIAYSGTLDLSNRQYPSTWLIVEADIVKVKSDKEKKKDKDKEKKKDVVSKDHVVNTTDIVHSNSESNNISSSPSQNSDLTSRMAYLAQQGSGGAAAAQLAMALGRSSPTLSTHRKEISSQVSTVPMQAIPQSAQSYEEPRSSNKSSTLDNNTNIIPQTSTLPLTNHSGGKFQPQLQQPIVTNAASTYGNSNTIPQDSMQNTYALAIVPGQESRSYYVGNSNQSQPQSQSNPNINPNLQSPSISQYQQPAYQQPVYPPSYYHMNMPNDNSLLNSNSHVMNSLQLLHGKIDQISMSLSSNSLYRGSNGTYPHTSTHSSNGNPVKIKADELISSIQSLVDSYDKLFSESTNGSSKDTITKLQDKIETLQAKYEKVMNEKALLLEKQSDLLQHGADSSSKFFSLQQQVDTISKEKQQLNDENYRLQNYVNQLKLTNDNSSIQRDQVETLQKEVISLKQSISKIQQEKILWEENKKTEYETEIDHIRKEYENRLLDVNSERTKLQMQLMDAEESIASLKNEIADSSIKSVDLSSSEVQSEIQSRTQAVEEKYQTRVLEFENRIRELEYETSQQSIMTSELEHTKESLSTTLEKVSSLELWIEKISQENQTLKESNSSTTSLNEDDVKLFMQDIYTKAMESFGEDGSTFSSNEVIKKIRVLLKTVTNDRLKK